MHSYVIVGIAMGTVVLASVSLVLYDCHSTAAGGFRWTQRRRRHYEQQQRQRQQRLHWQPPLPSSSPHLQVLVSRPEGEWDSAGECVSPAASTKTQSGGGSRRLNTMPPSTPAPLPPGVGTAAE